RRRGARARRGGISPPASCPSCSRSRGNSRARGRRGRGTRGRRRTDRARLGKDGSAKRLGAGGRWNPGPLKRERPRRETMKTTPILLGLGLLTLLVVPPAQASTYGYGSNCGGLVTVCSWAE